MSQFEDKPIANSADTPQPIEEEESFMSLPHTTHTAGDQDYVDSSNNTAEIAPALDNTQHNEELAEPVDNGLATINTQSHDDIYKNQENTEQYSNTANIGETTYYDSQNYSQETNIVDAAVPPSNNPADIMPHNDVTNTGYHDNNSNNLHATNPSPDNLHTSNHSSNNQHDAAIDTSNLAFADYVGNPEENLEDNNSYNTPHNTTESATHNYDTASYQTPDNPDIVNNDGENNALEHSDNITDNTTSICGDSSTGIAGKNYNNSDIADNIDADKNDKHIDGDASKPDNSNKSGKPPMRLGEKLIALGIVSEDQVQVALQEQRNSKKMLGQILMDMGFITESTLGEVLAESAGTKKFDPKATVLDPSLIRSLPKDIATRYKTVPVSMDNGTLTIATPDVYNVLAIDQIRRHFPRGTAIEPIYCSEAEILELIDKYYDYELSIDGILKEIETGIREKGALDNEEEGYTNPTVRLVNAILVDSIKRGASDIHFEPEGQFLRLRYRIDGSLEQIRSFHRDYWPAIAVRIKIISGMNIAETRMPQDGRISFQVMGREVDFRVATQPTVWGENIVMRLLDKTKSLVPLHKLGFAEHNINLLKKLIKRPEGIIIVTGPTGSGKTTTLYSILNYINSIDVNIMTLEDPVEYQLPLIRQTNVREGTVDFHNGIKSLMRQDPDIIFIGEVRDEETALMAVRAALTGHQVFTTLHTNDAMGAIPRLGDIGVPAHLLAGSLICTMAQRLARKLCPKCKQPRLATAEEARILGFLPDNPPTIWDPVGCIDCNNKGHKGRTAIIEILHIDEGMNELIATHATRNAMMEYALENGFISMMEDGIDKVLNGEIDINQLINTIDMTERL